MPTAPRPHAGPRRRSLRAGVRRLARGRRGGAVVEFALVAPVLLLLVCAVIDFARFFVVSLSLTAAVRDGARLAATLANPLDAAQAAAARSRVVAGFVAFGGDPLTAGAVSVVPTLVGGIVNTVTVQVTNYRFTPITPMASSLGLGNVTISRTAVFRWERAS